MDTRTLLEQDQERFLTRLAQADTPERTVTEIEEELNRILLQYNETCTDERMREAALHAFQTARAAAGLVDSGGEIRVYERTLTAGSGSGRLLSGTGGGKPGLPMTVSKPFLGPLAAGAASSVIGALLFIMAPESIRPFAAALMIVGGIVLFWAGTRFGAGKGTPVKRDQIFESKPDPDKIYRRLHTRLTVIDQTLEDVRLSAEADTETPLLTGKEAGLPDEVRLSAEADTETPLLTGKEAGLPDEELQLLRGLLETAYTQNDRDAADASISDIRFYLHKHGIDVVDYNVETAKWFNLMPSKGQGTLCPALVKEGTVLIKGTAAAGR